MRTINIAKTNQTQFSNVERLAMALCAVDNNNDKNKIWIKVDGYFTNPYSDPDNLSIPENHYYCDDIVNKDGKIQPVMYLWRFWAYKARQINYILESIEISVSPPKENYVMEVNIPVKPPEVVQKFSKEATDA